MKSSARIPLLIGLLTMVVLIGGMATWAAVASISGAIIAQGSLEPLARRQAVQHPDGGVVDTVFVTEGAAVTAGQPLLRLAGHKLRSEQTAADTQYFEILARIARLEAERDGRDEIDFPNELLQHAQDDGNTAPLIHGQRSLFSARVQTLTGQMDQIAERVRQTESQASGYKTQLNANAQQTRLIGQDLTDKQQLREQGLVPAATITALEREYAKLEGENGALTAMIAQTQARIAELRLEAINLSAQRREDAMAELRDLRVYEVQIQQQRAVRSDQIAHLVITAPISGIIHDFRPVTAGSVVRSADAIAYIVPTDQTLIIAAHIAPIDRDALYIGQPATLRFPSFSAATPTATGTVTMISADMFEGARGHNYFRAEITLPQETENTTLLPGMPVDVFLATGTQSAAHYLFKPLTDYFQRAFRDH